MTANPASTPIPSTTILPRLGRGVCWRDIAREIELDAQDQQARAECTPTPDPVQTPAENERSPEQPASAFRELAEDLNEVPTPSLGATGSSLGLEPDEIRPEVAAAITAAIDDKLTGAAIVDIPPAVTASLDDVVDTVHAIDRAPGWLRNALRRFA